MRPVTCHAAVLVLVTGLVMVSASIAFGGQHYGAASGPDSARGQRLYEARCIGCHSLDANRVGPKHRGVLGRVAGSLPDYRYSTALKSSRLIWAQDTLDAWLVAPENLIPGQRMNYRVANDEDRSDIIAYLIRVSGG